MFLSARRLTEGQFRSKDAAVLRSSEAPLTASGSTLAVVVGGRLLNEMGLLVTALHALKQSKQRCILDFATLKGKR